MPRPTNRSKRNHSSLFVGVIAALALCSCGVDGNPNETLQAVFETSADDLQRLYALAPLTPAIVTCCEVRDDLGNQELIWGGGSDCAVLVPDSAGRCASFYIPNPWRVLVWVERAYGPGETPDWNSLEPIGGATVNAALRPIIRELSVPGVSTIDRFEWDCTDVSGSPVPDGYYRVYAALRSSQYTGSPAISWIDLLVIKDSDARRDFIATMEAPE